MVQITLATATTRKTLIVDGGVTVRDILNQENLTTAGMTYHANGTALTNLDTPARELGESVMLVAVPAQKAGLQ